MRDSFKKHRVFIPLTKGKVTVINHEDYEKIKTYKWHYRDTGYAVCYSKGSITSRKQIRMHRLLTDCPEGKEVDHIDGDRLNNCRENLRTCTRSQNMMNKGKPEKGSSRFKGVSWHIRAGKWRARIKLNGAEIYLGIFKREEDAYNAYKKACHEYHKEFANVGDAT